MKQKQDQGQVLLTRGEKKAKAAVAKKLQEAKDSVYAAVLSNPELQEMITRVVNPDSNQHHGDDYTHLVQAPAVNVVDNGQHREPAAGGTPPIIFDPRDSGFADKCGQSLFGHR